MSDTREAETIAAISEVRFRVAPGQNGLLGYASCRVGDLILNDLSIVRAADGNLIVVHPRRFSKSGHAHYVHEPVGHAMAAALNEAIVGRLLSLLGTAAATDAAGDLRCE